MEDVMKIVKTLENCDLLITGITKTIENKIKEQRGAFLGMLLCRCKFNRKYFSR